MNSSDTDLTHLIRMRYGTSPFEPSESQLNKIKAEIKSICNLRRDPTVAEWNEIVKRNCPSAGSHGYHGANMSDLITLLKLATKPN